MMTRPKNTEVFGHIRVRTHTAVVSEGVERVMACWYVYGDGEAILGAAADLGEVYRSYIRIVPCRRMAHISGCGKL